MFQDLVEKKKSICVVGLGYVGLPVALEMARKFKVIGFDINAERVELMRNGIDPSKELVKEEFEGTDIHFTSNTEDIKPASFYVIAVPTPIDEHKNPDLKPLLGACEIVGKALQKGDVAVFESTVYPGCTEEDCVPVLEKMSGLTYPEDFSIGYSPERINPGDREHTLTRITKVVSGNDQDTLELVADVYDAVIDAGVHKASSIKVAEASKVIENTQRDLNIALMNELSIIFKKMDINTYEVLKASSTKWNFLKFYPGLVGGHCIGVDPYYLTYKANELGYHSKVILSGRYINDSMGTHIAKEVIQELIEADKLLKRSRVLVMGVTFKENVADIRNSKVPELVVDLKEFKVNVDCIDPHADPAEFKHEYGIELKNGPEGKYDALILAVSHSEYLELDSKFLTDILDEKAVIYDVKGVMKDVPEQFALLSL